MTGRFINVAIPTAIRTIPPMRPTQKTKPPLWTYGEIFLTNRRDRMTMTISLNQIPDAARNPALLPCSSED